MKTESTGLGGPPFTPVCPGRLEFVAALAIPAKSAHCAPGPIGPEPDSMGQAAGPAEPTTGARKTMERHEKARKGIAPLLGSCLLLLAVLALIGCAEREAPEPAPSGEVGETTPAPPRAVRLDLVADLPGAWLGQGSAEGVLDRDREARFTQGWHAVQNETPEQAFIWSRGKRSVIEITVLEPENRVLEIDIEPSMAEEKLPHQSVRIFWNSHDLGRFALDWKRQTLTVDLPAEVQATGLNRLTFSPLYWISPLTSRTALDSRPIAFRLHGVRFSGANSTASAGTALAEVEVEGNQIRQPADSMIAWHYKLPDDAKLHVGLKWDLPAESGTPLWQWVARDAQGEESILAELSPIGAGEKAMTIDLSRYAGQMLGLQSVLRSSSAEKTSVSIILDAPYIGGTEPTALPVHSPQHPYNVLLVLFDTLRSDHLEPYGGTTVRTPALKQFASTGFTFEQAHSNASWTRPSIASLWTGLHPSAHQVGGKSKVLPESLPYLPEILAQAGYLTVAVSNNAFFSQGYGFGRGFSKLVEYYESRARVLKEIPSAEDQADRVWQQFFAPAFENEEDRPVLALLHEIDPHSPYEAPASYLAPYAIEYSGNIDGWRPSFREHLLVLRAINDHGDWLAPEDKEQMRSLYKAEVSFVDEYFGALLDRLEESGQRDNTVVVLLSDHGEQLFDHGLWGHGKSVYQEELRIPLIFSLPGVIPEGGRSVALVQGVDILPTLLDLLGIPKPEIMSGQSLLPVILGPAGSPGPEVPIYSWSNISIPKQGAAYFGSEKLVSVRLGRWKLARTTRKRGTPYHTYQLFDLEKDAGEQNDIWFRQTVVGHTLRQLLENKIRQDEGIVDPSPLTEPIDEEVEQNLRALGYIE